jgi:hypothetical protein
MPIPHRSSWSRKPSDTTVSPLSSPLPWQIIYSTIPTYTEFERREPNTRIKPGPFENRAINTR